MEQQSMSGNALRGNVLNQHCPSRAVLKQMTSRWGFLALLALRGKTLRFGELRRMVEGVSEKMLAQTLKDLEAIGLVSRHSRNTVPPRSEERRVGKESRSRWAPYH